MGRLSGTTAALSRSTLFGGLPVQSGKCKPGTPRVACGRHSARFRNERANSCGGPRGTRAEEKGNCSCRRRSACELRRPVFERRIVCNLCVGRGEREADSQQNSKRNGRRILANLRALGTA